MSTLFIVHLVLCSYMTGLIWLVQLVHYPSFRFWPEMDFPKCVHFHSRAITPITAIPMVVELLSGLSLLALEFRFVFILNILLIAATWIATFMISVPKHNKLSQAKSGSVIESLVWTNWFRTIFWSIRLLLLSYTAAISCKLAF